HEQEAERGVRDAVGEYIGSVRDADAAGSRRGGVGGVVPHAEVGDEFEARERNHEVGGHAEGATGYDDAGTVCGLGVDLGDVTGESYRAVVLDEELLDEGHEGPGLHDGSG